jgi:hypothetical protein
MLGNSKFQSLNADLNIADCTASKRRTDSAKADQLVHFVDPAKVDSEPNHSRG